MPPSKGCAQKVYRKWRVWCCTVDEFIIWYQQALEVCAMTSCKGVQPHTFCQDCPDVEECREKRISLHREKRYGRQVEEQDCGR